MCLCGPSWNGTQSDHKEALNIGHGDCMNVGHTIRNHDTGTNRGTIARMPTRVCGTFSIQLDLADAELRTLQMPLGTQFFHLRHVD